MARFLCLVCLGYWIFFSAAHDARGAEITGKYELTYRVEQGPAGGALGPGELEQHWQLQLAGRPSPGFAAKVGIGQRWQLHEPLTDATGFPPPVVEDAHLTYSRDPAEVHFFYNENHFTSPDPFRLWHRSIWEPNSASLTAVISGEMGEGRLVGVTAVPSPAGPAPLLAAQGTLQGNPERFTRLTWLWHDSDDVVVPLASGTAYLARTQRQIAALDGEVGTTGARLAYGAARLGGLDRDQWGDRLLGETAAFARLTLREDPAVLVLGARYIEPEFRSLVTATDPFRRDRQGFDVEWRYGGRTASQRWILFHQDLREVSGTDRFHHSGVGWRFRPDAGRPWWDLDHEWKQDAGVLQHTSAAEVSWRGADVTLRGSLDWGSPARVRARIRWEPGEGRLGLGLDSHPQAWRLEATRILSATWTVQAVLKERECAVPDCAGIPPAARTGAAHRERAVFLEAVYARAPWQVMLQVGEWDRGRIDWLWGRPLSLMASVTVAF